MLQVIPRWRVTRIYNSGETEEFFVTASTNAEATTIATHISVANPKEMLLGQVTEQHIVRMD